MVRPSSASGEDNSIAEYGVEAGQPELAVAARALHSYLVARAARDWPLACDYLSRRERTQLAQIASSSPQIDGGGCAAGIAALSARISTAAARALTIVDAASLRREGNSAFLLYRGAALAGYFIALAKQGSAWKVAGLDPTAFP